MQDIHDIRPPVPVGMDPGFLRAGLILLALVVLGIVGYFIYRYFKRKHPGVDTTLPLLPPPLPPLEAALNELNRLDDLMASHPRLFYFRLTEILKRFMGRQFNIKALEMHTQELVPALKDTGLDRSLFSDTREFLLFSDMIKYAGQAPSSPMMTVHLAFVRTFVAQVGEKDEKNNGEGTDA